MPIDDRVDRASATETVDGGLILSWVKPKTIKLGIHSFSDYCLALKGQM